MKILLSCQGGFSSSLVVSKVKEEAQKRGLDIDIKTVAQGDIADTIDQYDILMIAPQIKYIETKCRELCAKKHKPFTIISQMDYGRCNGKNILDTAITLVNEFE